MVPRYSIPQAIKNLIIAKLREKRLKLTPQRMAIIEALARKTDQHPAVSIIHKEAKKLYPGLSLSAVYYTLAKFSKLGFIKELEFEEMENRYETNMDNHINLICKGCGCIMDYKSLEVNFREVEGESGFRATASRFELYGYCRNCMKS